LRLRAHLEHMIKSNKKLNIVFSKTKYQLMSPKKLNRIAVLIRKKTVSESMSILRNMNQRSALLLYKSLYSAYANAINNHGMSSEKLLVNHILINEGPRHKRFQPRARGRMYKIIKRTSHIIIGVTEGEIGGAKN